MEHGVEMDETHSKGNSLQKNMTVKKKKSAGAIDVAESTHQ